MRPALITMAVAAALCVAACSPAPAAAEGSLFAVEADRQWSLPEGLREISGLAVSPDGRLFGHNDETGTIYEIDFERGAVVKSFALGDGAVTGDFEGLTITPEGDFWLTDSRGRLLRFREGADNARVQIESFDTGIGEICEVEGIAYRIADRSFLLACKRMRGREARGAAPQLRAWSIADGETRTWAELDADIASATGVRSFRPSDLEFDQRSGRLIVLSANDGAIAELSQDGAVLSVRALSREHRQAEGAAILPDGSLLLADEGGDGQALISRYPRLP